MSLLPGSYSASLAAYATVLIGVLNTKSVCFRREYGQAKGDRLQQHSPLRVVCPRTCPRVAEVLGCYWRGNLPWATPPRCAADAPEKASGTPGPAPASPPGST